MKFSRALAVVALASSAPLEVSGNPACPVTEPGTGDSCPQEGQQCFYGAYECCGSVFHARSVQCFGDDGWNTFGFVPRACPLTCPDGCTSDIPSTGHPCTNPGQVCGYGTTECCGNTYSAEDAICTPMRKDDISTWEIVPNDNCLEGCNGDGDMDPHFRSWSGQWFDYQGVCDMMFLQSNNFGGGKGLRIHIRTKGRYEYSYIETAAVQIASDTLEVNSFGEWSLNGVTTAELEGIKLGGSYPVVQTIHNKKHSLFNITISENEQIVLTTFKDMVGVHLKRASFANFGDSVGLMGNYTTGTKLDREGVPLLENDPSLFGQEWQVLQSEPDLFSVMREPQHPAACVVPAKTATTRRRLGSSVVSKEQAEAACARWDANYKHFCVMDVLALQDLDAAEAGQI